MSETGWVANLHREQASDQEGRRQPTRRDVARPPAPLVCITLAETKPEIFWRKIRHVINVASPETQEDTSSSNMFRRQGGAFSQNVDAYTSCALTFCFLLQYCLLLRLLCSPLSVAVRHLADRAIFRSVRPDGPSPPATPKCLPETRFLVFVVPSRCIRIEFPGLKALPYPLNILEPDYFLEPRTTSQYVTRFAFLSRRLLVALWQGSRCGLGVCMHAHTLYIRIE